MEDNITLDFKDTKCEVVDWIRLTEGRAKWRVSLNTVKNFRKFLWRAERVSIEKLSTHRVLSDFE